MARTVFLAGHARLPQTTAAQGLYDNVVIAIEIDPKYCVVVRASCNLVTDVGRDFVAELIVGHSLRDGIEPLIEDLKAYYQGKAQNALIAAMRDLWRTFEAWKG